METRSITAAQQICFGTLCGLDGEIQRQPRREAAIASIAFGAMRRVSKRRQQCAHCPYAGACQNPRAYLATSKSQHRTTAH